MSAAGRDQHLADGDALDVHAEDRRGDVARPRRRDRGELHAAGLAAAADEDLGLDHDRLGAGAEEPFGGGARLVDGVGDLPVGDRQALGDEQRLGVGFLDLHASAMAGLRRRDGRPSGGER